MDGLLLPSGMEVAGLLMSSRACSLSAALEAWPSCTQLATFKECCLHGLWCRCYRMPLLQVRCTGSIAMAEDAVQQWCDLGCRHQQERTGPEAVA